jgi:hypothetical protein
MEGEEVGFGGPLNGRFHGISMGFHWDYSGISWDYNIDDNYNGINGIIYNGIIYNEIIYNGIIYNL